MYTLTYADDIVLLAEDEEGMRNMIERLEGYMERKKLEVNTEKTKIMRFRRGGGYNGEEGDSMARYGEESWRM